VYALVGDDIRLMATNKPADYVFNVITCVAIAVFTFEIIISCLGRDDYILGFFMALDVVSTATLLLDLSFVYESVMGGTDNMDNMRSGRTARVGAKAGRVVRVIRLVRILKLYKAIYETRSKQRSRTFGNDDDDWDDIGEDENMRDMQGLQESRVGKKLSEMTTRRVIILVLTMLLVLPFLRAQSADNYPSSSYYAADEVHKAWVRHNQMPDSLQRYERYERTLLRYIYFHNWFAGNSKPCSDGDQACPSWYFSKVFWVGLMSSEKNTIHSRVNTTHIRLSSVQAFNEYAAQQKDIYNFGTIPDIVHPTIGGEWKECNEESKGIFRSGFSLIGREIDGQVSYAVPCPHDLRNTERAKFFPRLVTVEHHQEWHFAFYFDTRDFVQQEAMFGIIITAFICVVLCVASLYFSNDANKLVLQPVEQMIKRVEAIRENPLAAMKMADEEFKHEQKLARAREKFAQKPFGIEALKANFKKKCRCGSGVREEAMETVVLEKTIIKLGSLLALGFGEAGASIIGHNLACSDSAGVNVPWPQLQLLK
jgi:hypothetical protein